MYIYYIYYFSQFVTKKAAEFGLGFEVVAKLRFDLPNTFRCHKQKSVDIEVDFIRFELKTGGGKGDHSSTTTR